MHYAEFLFPGSFVSETTYRPVESRDQRPELPRGAYGWRFFDREEVEMRGKLLRGERENVSPWTYLGKVWTLERVKREMPQETILIGNMERNDYSRVVECAQGFIPLYDGDAVEAPPAALGDPR